MRWGAAPPRGGEKRVAKGYKNKMENFGRVAKGGRKILDESFREWRKILNFEFFGILWENKGTCIKLFA